MKFILFFITVIVIQGINLPIPSFGNKNPDCLFHVPSNTLLQEQDNGDVLVQPPQGDSYILTCKSNNISHKEVISGYFEYAMYQSPGITSFSGLWTVPQPPASIGTGIVYLWNGLVQFNVNQSTVLQPVLQYGRTPAGGGDYWGVASWYVTATGIVMYSDLVQVNTDDVILGNMYLSGSTWLSVATDKNSGKSSTLRVNGLPSQDYAYVVLEVYVTGCSNLPPNPTTFSALSLSNANGPITAQWGAYPTNECNSGVTIVNPQTVTIT